MKSEDSSSSSNIVKKCLQKNKFTSGDSSSRSIVKRYLEKKKFTSVKPLDRGGFGDILSAITPKNEVVAVKIVKNTLSWNVEELIWPVLKHPYILPLNDIVDLREMNLKLYFMPKHPTSLDKIIRNSEFLADPNGLNRIRKWLQNIIDGLNYLHNAGFVHLDIKSDNCLITAEDAAVLCDFSGVNWRKKASSRLIAPYVYRPPESFDISEKHQIDGATFDIWTYALMSLNVLTRNWPSYSLGDVYDLESWKRNIEPILKKSLELETFYNIMKSSLPAVNMSEEDIRLAHDFVSTMMQWDPNSRPTSLQILDHNFLFIENCQKEVMDESDENKEKISKTSLEDLVISESLSDDWVKNTDENTVHVSAYPELIIENSSLPVLNEQQISETERSRVDEFLTERNSDVIHSSIQSSAEKLKLDTDSDQKVVPKKKKNLGGRIKRWLAKKFNWVLNARRKI